MQSDGSIRHRHDVLRADEAREVGLEAVDEFPLRRNPSALEALHDIRLFVTAELRTVNGNSDSGKGRAHQKIIVRGTNAKSIVTHSVAPPDQWHSRCCAKVEILPESLKDFFATKVEPSRSPSMGRF